MRNPDQFDAFYKDARSRLLLQTYALTGDLGASRAAVRDSFVVAWHHWRKVGKGDPETWARPHAWAHAQRRHTARLWHRDKGLDPEVKATLDALGKLPMTQRKALLLNHLTTIPMSDMARELGLTRVNAERELQTATSQFSMHRDVPTTSIRALFEPLREHVEGARWPRATIVRRAGAARRRTHTAVGAAVAVAALVVSGTLVTDAAGVRPTLARDEAPTSAAVLASPSASASDAARVALPPDALLSADEVAAAVHGRGWTATATNDNTSGDGLVLPCQQERYADPKGTAALVRRFQAAAPGGHGPHAQRASARPGASQLAELSSSVPRAQRAFDTTVQWYAGCTAERVQLLSTRRVDHVGDRAMMLVLRDWHAPATTLVVGLARTGSFTTTTLTRSTSTGTPDFGANARLLASAVGDLCRLADSGACSEGRPRLTVVPPPAVGTVSGMLSEVDLPPVTGVTAPWVGTEPRKAVTNVAATSCDHASFGGHDFSHNITRSYLVPEARLADEFGLTETVGALPVAGAKAFVADVRKHLAGCSDKDLTTHVTEVSQLSTGRQDLSVWHVRTEISDKSSVDFLMGVVRDGTAVAQVGFVPDGHATMPPGAFLDLVHRALDRLRYLPGPS
ncbi:MAG: hypothetical protein ACXVW0_06975 [Nocardioides sp.]